MKKYLPLILFAVGLVVLVGGIIFLKSRKTSDIEEESVPEIPFEQRPVVSLTPSEDGHWLKLVIEKIEVEAASLDYELLYQLPDGRTQGVPGTLKLDKDRFERDLLLGSESSGKFRYDEGVEVGSLTLRFRNEKGKLVGKLSTKFRLISDSDALVSEEGNFEYRLDGKSEGVFFVVMNTFGVNRSLPGEARSGPWGVFKSENDNFPGEVKMDGTKIYKRTFDGWSEVSGGKASDAGIFISTD